MMGSEFYANILAGGSGLPGNDCSHIRATATRIAVEAKR